MKRKLLVLLVAGFAVACSDDSSPTAPIDRSAALTPAAELSGSPFGDASALGGGSFRIESSPGAGTCVEVKG